MFILTDFWEEQHTTNDSYWLTGSTSHEIFKWHSLDNVTNKKVLEIGIGLGHFTKELFLLKNEVFASDISQQALNRVKDFSKTYLTNDLKNIEPVDLTICHLVFQHCNDSEIERIINDVNLTENGVFSFQFAFIRDNEVPNEKVMGFINKGTHHFRTIDKIKDIVDSSNKKIIWVSEPIHWNDTENFSWYMVKLQNK